jgi:large subunit ribosomal protein L10
MPTAEKAKAIEDAKERYGRSTGVIFTEYRGLKVGAMQQLRQSLKEKEAEIQVVKNTLFKIAAGDDAEQFPEEFSSGPIAVTYIYGSEPDAAKALVEFRKKNDKLVIKGGFVNGAVLSDSQIEDLSKLPTRDELLSQIIGLVVAPITELAATVEAIYAGPVRQIGQLADKAEKEGGITASESSSEEKPSDDAPAEEAPASEESAPTETPETESEAEEKPSE